MHALTGRQARSLGAQSLNELGRLIRRNDAEEERRFARPRTRSFASAGRSNAVSISELGVSAGVMTIKQRRDPVRVRPAVNHYQHFHH